MTAGFDVHVKFVESLLAAEATRKTAIEQKAAAVITTSGTLVTLLFGLVAVISTKATYALPREAHGWLGAAMIAFVAAAVLALWISFPRPYGASELTLALVEAWWLDSPSQANARVVGLQISALDTARKVNDRKAKFLKVALLAEVVAVGLLAIAVGIVLHCAKP